MEENELVENNLETEPENTLWYYLWHHPFGVYLLVFVLSAIFILFWPFLDMTVAEFVATLPVVFVINTIIFVVIIYPLMLLFGFPKNDQA